MSHTHWGNWIKADEVVQMLIRVLMGADSWVNLNIKAALWGIELHPGLEFSIVQPVIQDLSNIDSWSRLSVAVALRKLGKVDDPEVIQAHRRNLSHTDSGQKLNDFLEEPVSTII